MVSALLGATVIINSAIFTIDTFGKSPVDMAYLFIAFGVGSTAAALTVNRLKEHLSVPMIITWGVIVGLVSVIGCAAYLPNWFTLGGYCILFGVSAAMIDTLINHIVHQVSNDHNQRALFAANFTLTHSAWLIAYLVAGYLGSGSHVHMYFMVLTVIIAAVLLAMMVPLCMRSNKTT